VDYRRRPGKVNYNNIDMNVFRAAALWKYNLCNRVVNYFYGFIQNALKPKEGSSVINKLA